MGDYAWGRIVIGGPMKRSVIEEIVGECLGGSGSLDMGEDQTIEDLLDDGHIVVEDDQLRGGTFDFEEELVEAGIPFDRQAGRHYTWDPSLRRFRPGIGDFEHTNDEDGDSWYIDVEKVRKALAEGPGALRTLLDKEYPILPNLEPITWLPEDAEIDAALGA